MIWFAYAMAWVASAAVAGVAIYVSGSTWPLLIMVFPALIEVKQKGDKCDCGE